VCTLARALSIKNVAQEQLLVIKTHDEKGKQQSPKNTLLSVNNFFKHIIHKCNLLIDMHNFFKYILSSISVLKLIFLKL
jgi:hypothetical protein